MCGGKHLERGVQEAVKTPVKPLASPLDSALRTDDIPDLDNRKAAEIAKDREKWKSLRPAKRC